MQGTESLAGCLFQTCLLLPMPSHFLCLKENKAFPRLVYRLLNILQTSKASQKQKETYKVCFINSFTHLKLVA